MIATAQTARPSWLLPFGVTLVAMFTLQLSNLGFSPLLPSIQQDVRMTYTQLGLFTGLYGLLAMLLSVPAGITARRYGEKRVLALGLVGVAIGSVLLGRASSFESALAFRGLVIFGYRFAFVSVLIAVALTSPLSLRGRTMGVLGATRRWLGGRCPLGGASPASSAGGSRSWGTFMALLGAAVILAFYRPTVDAEPVPTPAPAAPGPRERVPLAGCLAARARRRSRRLRSIRNHCFVSVAKVSTVRRRGRGPNHRAPIRLCDRAESAHRGARRPLRQTVVLGAMFVLLAAASIL